MFMINIYSYLSFAYLHVYNRTSLNHTTYWNISSLLIFQSLTNQNSFLKERCWKHWKFVINWSIFNYLSTPTFFKCSTRMNIFPWNLDNIEILGKIYFLKENSYLFQSTKESIPASHISSSSSSQSEANNIDLYEKVLLLKCWILHTRNG